MRGLLLCSGGVLLFAGAALLGRYCQDLRLTARAQRQAKNWIDSTAAGRRSSEVQPPASRRPAVRRGDPLGELETPRLRLSVMVFEGDDAGILKVGAGHLPGTALSPAKGNNGIAAHRDTFFRPLPAVHPNDMIAWRTPSGDTRFRVTKTEIVQPLDVSVLAQARGRDLTLVTWYPFSYIGHAPQRFIVYAQRLSD